MICICYYDSETDMKPVRVGLNIDLSRALREGIVKDSGVEPEFNNIEDPSKIKGRTNDVFEALEQRNSVLNKASQKAAPAPVSPSNPESDES